MEPEHSSPSKLEFEHIDKGMYQEGQSPTRREVGSEGNYVEMQEDADGSFDGDDRGNTIDQQMLHNNDQVLSIDPS